MDATGTKSLRDVGFEVEREREREREREEDECVKGTESGKDSGGGHQETEALISETCGDVLRGDRFTRRSLKLR